jgi:hypothetical protein
MALVVESGLFDIVLRQQVSHLLCTCTTFSYGTLSTVACAHQGCSANYHHHHVKATAPECISFIPCQAPAVKKIPNALKTVNDSEDCKF